MYAAGIAIGLLLIIAVIKKAWPLMKGWMSAANKGLKIGKAFMWGVWKIIDGIWNVLSGIWEGDLAKVFKGIFLQILPGIAAILYAVIAGLISFIVGIIPVLITAMIQAAIHIVEGIGKAIRKLGKKLKGEGIPFIPGIHTGGTIMKGGVAVVGERGPEIVNLPKGARVHSNEVSSNMLGETNNTFHIHVNGRVRASDTEIRDIANKVAREINLRMNRTGTNFIGA